MLFKHIIDLSVAAGILFALSPVLLIIAVVIKLDSSGPVIFRQMRLGKAGTKFDILKFRTMIHNAGVYYDESTYSIINMPDDPRITRTGRILRKTSLDELPQLINILRGEMSLIGPRPDLPTALDVYDSNEKDKLLVLPGLTGMSQVSGRNELAPKERWRLDAEYARNPSFKRDIVILAKTVLNVLRQRGIYGSG